MPKGGNSPKTKIDERKFQADLKKHLKERYDTRYVMKTDSQQIQGIPDILILKDDKWATLEFKKASDSKHQPNQDYYVEQMNNMSFSRIISPENKESVLNELDEFFNK